MTAREEVPLDGLKLFVVEDEALVAMLLENLLDSLGCVVVDVAGSVAQAMRQMDRIAEEADAAILDVNLGTERVYPVADELVARGVPFLFATGYGPSGVGDRYPGHTVLSKPYTKNMLVNALVPLCPDRDGDEKIH